MDVPKIFGRYQPLKVLGAGRRSRVMMVKDLLDNETRALKVLLDEAGREGFFREFELLAGINHPQVIKVFDFGQDGSGLRYFTMEYLPGRPLSGAVSEGLSLPRVTTIAAQLFSALAAIHSRGILHADLKPQNIFLVEEGDGRDRIKLLDFGLAGNRREDDLGRRRGTLPYMAPEWFQGGRVDHRSDLYSAGIVIFELLTGKTPFDGVDAREMIQRKIQADVPSLNDLRPDCPPELTRLVGWLLERDPTRRPQSATEALRAIEADGQSAALSSPSLVLAGLPAVGRQDVVERFRRAMEMVATSMHGQMFLVQADEGGGKSRILQEIKPLVQREGHRLLEARGGDVNGQPPIRQLLMQPVKLETKENESLIDRNHGVLQQVFSEMDRSPVAPLRSSSESLGMMDGLSSFLIELAGQTPLVILFDDLHKADPLAQGMFSLLGWRLAEAPLLICATVDPDWLDGGEAQRELARRKGVEVIRLSPLTADDLTTLLQDVFGTVQGIPRLAEELEGTTGGNPALVTEAIESLVDSGALFHERGRWYLAEERAYEVLDPSRGSVRTDTLLERRIEPLTAVERELLEAAAVLGTEFDEKLLVGFVGGGSWVSGVLDRLERRGLLLRAKDRPERLRFQQPRLQPYLLDHLPQEGRRALHRRAGEFILTSVGTIDDPRKLPDQDLDALAQHFLAAQDLDSGRTFGIEAAQRAEQNQAYRLALERYQQLVDLAASYSVTPPPDILEKIADLKVKLGKVDEALAEYHALIQPNTPWEEGWTSTPHGSLPARARVFGKLGTVYGEYGEYAKALEALGRAIELIPENDLRTRLHLAALRSSYLLAKGDLDAAEGTAKAAIEAAGDHPLPRLVAPTMRLWASLADVAASRRRLDEAEVCIDRGLNLAHPSTTTLSPSEVREIRKRTADLHYIRGLVLSDRRAYPEAIISTLEALGHYEELCDLKFVAWCYKNLGNAYFRMGDWNEAIEYWERQREIAERTRSRKELATALASLGNAYLEAGRFERASVALIEGLRLARKVNLRLLLPALMGHLGEVETRQGHYEEAHRLLDRGLRLARALESNKDMVRQMRRLAQLHLEEGRFGRLRRTVDEAIVLAQQAELPREEGILLGLRGVEAAHRNMTDLALQSFRAGDELLAVTKADLERARLKYWQGIAYDKMGFPSEAEAALRFGEETFRRLRADWDLARTKDELERLGGAGGKGTPAFRKLQLLLEVTRGLNAEIELEPLLTKVLEKAIELTQTERGFVILLDEHGNPTFHTTMHMPRVELERGKVAQVSSTVINRVFESGAAIAVTDVEQEFDLRTRASIVELGLRAIMCAPLRRGDKILGLIYVDSSKVTEGFYQADISLLEALGDAAAVSLENAKLVDALRRKTDLMSMLAHEFRSPISATIAFTQQLLRHANNLTGEQRESLEAIREQGYRLNRMIGNILDLAMMEADKLEWQMEELDMGEVIRASVRELEPLAQEKGIRVDVQVPSSSDRVYGNLDRLIQVCTNLLSNALKFTPQKGRVGISSDTIEHPALAASPLSSRRAHQESWATRSPGQGKRLSETRYLAVRFVDTGPGIAPEDLTRIFGRFTQSGDATTRKQGTGLGLNIAQEIVAEHGGRLWAENAPGGGSMFVFCLPVVTSDEHAGENRAP